jgi:hypothetical protein
MYDYILSISYVVMACMIICYGMYDYIYQKIKNPALMTQAGYHRIPKMNWCDWVIMFMIEWLAMPHTLCPDQGSMVSYSIVLAWSTSACLTGLIRSSDSAYVESNWEPHGHQPNAYTHQPTVVVIISVQMCVYIPLNMWKYQRNQNLKFQKLTLPGIEPRSSESFPAIIPLDHWHIYRNIKSENINLIWLLVFSHRDKTSKRRLQLSGLLDLVDFLSEIKNFKLVFKIW